MLADGSVSTFGPGRPGGCGVVEQADGLHIERKAFDAYRRSRAGATRWISAVFAVCPVLLCAGMAAGQDAALRAAVGKCLEQDATGACACAGTSCSQDPRFTGEIGAWDTSGVRDMDKMCVLRWG